ncbi:MAG: hypothetical protein WDW36_002657 [Sanguina aurantia]
MRPHSQYRTITAAAAAAAVTAATPHIHQLPAQSRLRQQQGGTFVPPWIRLPVVHLSAQDALGAGILPPQQQQRPLSCRRLTPARPLTTLSRVETQPVPRAQEQITRLTREQADQHAVALGTLREEQKRMTALKKDMAEVEHQNDVLRGQLASIDVKALRESAAALVAASDEAQALCAAVQSMGGVAARLEGLRAERAALLPLTQEAAELEADVVQLRGLQGVTHSLRLEIAALQPRVAVVERLRKQVATLQAEADNTEALQAQSLAPGGGGTRAASHTLTGCPGGAAPGHWGADNRGRFHGGAENRGEAPGPATDPPSSAVCLATVPTLHPALSRERQVAGGGGAARQWRGCGEAGAGVRRGRGEHAHTPHGTRSGAHRTAAAVVCQASLGAARCTVSLPAVWAWVRALPPLWTAPDPNLSPHNTVAALSGTAEQLPALKARHARMQASVADVRALERRVAEWQKQEALQGRLEAQLQELQGKVGGAAGTAPKKSARDRPTGRFIDRPCAFREGPGRKGAHWVGAEGGWRDGGRRLTPNGRHTRCAGRRWWWLVVVVGGGGGGGGGPATPNTLGACACSDVQAHERPCLSQRADAHSTCSDVMGVQRVWACWAGAVIPRPTADAGMGLEAASLQTSVADVEAAKLQVDALRLKVSESSALESRIAALMREAQRLPVLRAQHQKLAETVAEVGGLEAAMEGAREQVAYHASLKQQIALLAPKAAGVEMLRRQLAELESASNSAPDLMAQIAAIKASAVPEQSQRAAALASLRLESDPAASAAAPPVLRPGSGSGSGAAPESLSREVSLDRERVVNGERKFNSLVRRSEAEPAPLVPPGPGQGQLRGKRVSIGAALFERRPLLNASNEGGGTRFGRDVSHDSGGASGGGEPDVGALRLVRDPAVALASLDEAGLREAVAGLALQAGQLDDLVAQKLHLRPLAPPCNVTASRPLVGPQVAALRGPASEAQALQRTIADLTLLASKKSGLRAELESVMAEQVEVVRLEAEVAGLAAVMERKHALEVQASELDAATADIRLLERLLEGRQALLLQRPMVEAQLAVLAGEAAQVKALQVRLEESRALAQQRMELEAELKSLVESAAAGGGVAGLAEAHAQHAQLQLAVMELDSKRARCAQFQAQLQEADAVDARHAQLQADALQLSRVLGQVAELEARCSELGPALQVAEGLRGRVSQAEGGSGAVEGAGAKGCMRLSPQPSELCPTALLEAFEGEEARMSRELERCRGALALFEQTRLEATQLQAQVAECTALKQHVATLRGVTSEVNSLRHQHQDLLQVKAEFDEMSEAVPVLAPYAILLPTVRAEAERLRLMVDQVKRMQADNAILMMQFDVTKALLSSTRSNGDSHLSPPLLSPTASGGATALPPSPSPSSPTAAAAAAAAAAAPSPSPSSPTAAAAAAAAAAPPSPQAICARSTPFSDDNHHSHLHSQGGAAGPSHHHGSRAVMELGGGGLCEAPLEASSSQALSVVFERMRVLESDKADLQADNADLHTTIQSLRGRLEEGEDKKKKLQQIAETLKVMRRGGLPGVQLA